MFATGGSEFVGSGTPAGPRLSLGDHTNGRKGTPTMVTNGGILGRYKWFAERPDSVKVEAVYFNYYDQQLNQWLQSKRATTTAASS